MEALVAGLCTVVAAMALFVLATSGLVGLGCLAAQAAVAESRRIRTWLHRLGFTYDPGCGWHRTTLGGVPVAYRQRVTGAGAGTIVWHDLGVPVPRTTLRLARRGPVADPGLLGSPTFDAWYRAWGAPEDRALLTAPVRAALIEVARCGPGGITLRDGMLWAARQELDPRVLAPLIAASRTLAAAPPHPRDRLLRLARDPEPGVRVTALRWIAERRDRVLSEAVGWNALRAPEREVRAAAALALLAVGRVEPPVWAVVLDAVAGRELPRWLRRWAAAALGAGGSPAACLQAGQVLLHEPAMHRDAVELLCAAGRAGEPGLLRLVPDADPELLAMILRALAREGSVRAVPVLRARQRRLSILQGALSREIDRTVLAIQVRSGGQDGSLSLAPDPRDIGALSLPTDDRP